MPVTGATRLTPGVSLPPFIRARRESGPVSLHALDDIDDAYRAARAFLLPFDRGRWFRLALVVLFLGGSGFNVPMSGGDIPTGDTGTAPGAEMPEITTAILIGFAILIGVVLLLGLAYLFVGSVMEFVFIASLRDEEVTLRRYWGENLGRGARLFAFRVGLGVLGLLVFGGMVAILLAPILTGGGIAVTAVLFLAMIPVFFLAILLFAVVHMFTAAFVVPVMLHEDRRVIEGWRRFWPTVRANWKEYGAYAVMSWLLSIGLGIVVGIVMIVGALVLLVPALILGLIGVIVMAVLPPVGVLVLAVTGLLYLIGLIVAYALAQVAVQTFLRYYALFVLGDTNETFDLIPERRAAVRADEA